MLDRVGLPITVGVARTKFLAKVASGVAKPDGLLVVPPERELDFLHPLPIERLWGVGPITASKLHDRGINTVGEVARLGEGLLVALLGQASGRHLHALAHNRDPRPVTVGRRRRSIGSQHALGNRPRSPPPSSTRSLAELVDRVTRRMRAADRVGRTVVLRLRFDDFSRVTRSHTLPRATAQTEPILATVRALLHTARPDDRAARASRCSGSPSPTSTTSIVQLVLPFDRRAGGALDAALDDVRDRFGSAAVTRAALLGSRPRYLGADAPRLTAGQRQSVRRIACSCSCTTGTPSAWRLATYIAASALAINDWKSLSCSWAIATPTLAAEADPRPRHDHRDPHRIDHSLRHLQHVGGVARARAHDKELVAPSRPTRSPSRTHSRSRAAVSTSTESPVA